MVYANLLIGWLRILELMIAFSDYSGYGMAKPVMQASNTL